MFDQKRTIRFLSEMEEQIVDKKGLENIFYQNLIPTYEIFIFPAVSEISALYSTGSYEKIRLSQVFERTQEV